MGKRRAFTIFISLVLLMVAPNWTWAEESPYVYVQDITGHWAETEIQELVDMGVVQGFPDETARPNLEISRAEFLALLVRALDLQGTGDKGVTFRDVQAKDWFAQGVNTAVAHKIVYGYPDGTFRPNAKVTRAEIVAMVTRAAGDSVAYGKPLRNFADVPDQGWITDAVNKAVSIQLVSGYHDGTFRPNAHATRAEAMVIIRRLMGMQTVSSVLPSDETINKVVMGYENAGIEEMNSQKYSFEKSLSYTVGFARELTKAVAEEFQSRVQEGYIIHMEAKEQKAVVEEKAKNWAQVNYTFLYEVVLEGPDTKSTKTVAESTRYFLRQYQGQWKIYNTK